MKPSAEILKTHRLSDVSVKHLNFELNLFLLTRSDEWDPSEEEQFEEQSIEAKQEQLGDKLFRITAVEEEERLSG